jgi:hypothetical protein
MPGEIKRNGTKILTGEGAAGGRELGAREFVDRRMKQ